MKKLLSIVVIFLVLILSNTIVFADMSMPMIKGYTAVIDNVNGAIEYKNENGKLQHVGKLNYGTEIEVVYEGKSDEGIFATYITSENERREINIKDLKVIVEKDEFEIDQESKKEGTVLANDGIVLRVGPADAYDEAGVTIPKGEKIIVYREKNTYDSPWYYTEYNGKSGWFSERYGVIGYNSGQVIMTYADTYIKSPKNFEYIGVIPANTEIPEHYSLDPWTQNYYITYNGITGYVYDDDIAYRWVDGFNTKYQVIKPGVKLYEKSSPERELENVLYEEIPVGTILENVFFTFKPPEIIYTEYDGVKGWIYVNELVKIYRDSEENDIIQNSEIIKDNEIIKNSEIIKDNEIEKNVVKNEIKEDSKIENEEKPTKTMRYNLSTEEFVLFAVCIACVIACTSITTIILINKTYKKQ